MSTLRSLTQLALLSLVIAPVEARSEEAPLTLAPSSLVRIDGDSTLHKYHLEGHAAEVRITLDPAAGGSTLDEEAIRAGRVKTLTVAIPVAEMHSGEGDLDSNYRKAMHADVHPSITFAMESYRLLPATTPGPLHLEVTGKLTVNGVAQPEVLDVMATSTPAGLHLTGTQTLLMKAFQVEPPVLFLGTIRTANQVLITWDLLVPAPAS